MFQYRVPEDLLGSLEPGTVVEVPFGPGNRFIRGYVTGLSAHPDYDPGKIKQIVRVLSDAGDEEARLVGLAAWIRDHYGSTMLQALKTVIPVRGRVKSREKKTMYLVLSRKEAEEKLAFFRQKHQTARARMLEALIEEPVFPCELAAEKLNITPAVIKALEEQGILRVETEKKYRNPVAVRDQEADTIELNEEQKQIVEEISAEWEENPCGKYLIYGVTGSGKTEVYMELIARAVEHGQQAIMLIPEIALTYQTVLRFYRRFGDRVSVINSRLSAGERSDQFERARLGQLDVMIGPRSALFTPFPNLGIIVIDEEQEPAYQSESMPRYHAREVAMKRGEMEQAKVVLGSATPSLEAFYGAQTGKYRLFRLTKRAGSASLAQVEVVDLRKELREGNRSILSHSLRDHMKDTLACKEQVMLFLNRRGYAGFVSCRACGYVMKCPHCDVSLSLHKNGKLICHYCGYEQPQVKVCPQCGSNFIRAFRAGTQQIEEEVRRQFPAARVLRMDLDTTRAKDGHEKILSAFANHEADILIGTQMIVKGHDFPDVTLMGVLAADLSLHAVDFRAAERTFQLLTQAAGRAGRAGKPGHVVIQTYDPDHYSVRAAAAQDYESFYRQEITHRNLASYPPCGSMIAIHCSCLDESHLTLACGYLRKFIEKVTASHPVAILGPASEPIAKVQDYYRQAIYLKAADPLLLTAVKNKMERYVAANVGFATVSIQFEVD